MARLGLDFSFFDAIDGNQLSDAEISDVYDSEKNSKLFKRPLSRPKIGCYLSHFKIWEKVVQSNLHGAVILEDDFSADDRLPRVLQELSTLSLQNCLIKLHSKALDKRGIVGALAGNSTLFAPYTVSGLSTGYIIDRECASNLVNRSLPFGRPVDMDHKHWWELEINLLAIHPNLVGQSAGENDSSIETSRIEKKGRGLMAGSGRFTRNMVYQIHHQTARKRATANLPDLVSRLRSLNNFNTRAGDDV